jgi:hypothetical protein
LIVTTQTTRAEAKRFPVSAKAPAIISKEKASKEKQSAADPRQVSTSAAFFSSSTEETNDLLASPLTPATFDFIGYDLGEPRRVQVSNLSWTFEASDGMCLRLTREAWLQGGNKKERMTSVRITIPEELNEALRYYEGQVKDRFTSLFHLTMSSGITVAFSKLKTIAGEILSF